VEQLLGFAVHGYNGVHEGVLVRVAKRDTDCHFLSLPIENIVESLYYYYNAGGAKMQSRISFFSFFTRDKKVTESYKIKPLQIHPLVVNYKACRSPADGLTDRG
jgi:hypothetical protein